MADNLLQTTQEILPLLTQFRHQVHSHPELSGQEVETSKAVQAQLTAWGIPFRVGHTAVLGEIQGKEPGPCVVLRGDMDALPITEDSGLSFSSQIPGAMHACGHDIHTTILLGAAYILSRHRDFAGTVKLAFQPAEETGGGLEELKELGLLDPKPDAFLAAHICPDTPAGKLHVKAGPAMTASSRFHAEFTGTGGHAALPHKAQDCILAAARFVSQLPEISRHIDPLEPFTVSVGHLSAGEAGRGNIIPAKAELDGTIRTPKRSVHQQAHEQMRTLLQAVTLTAGVKGELSFRNGSDCVMNDPTLTKIFTDGAAKLLGADQVLESPGVYLASDNFARLSAIAPAVYFRLGGKPADLSQAYPLHSPRFLADDQAIFPGAAALSQGALDFLSHLRRYPHGTD